MKVQLAEVSPSVQIKPGSNVIILKTTQPGRIWSKVIKQKHPGAISLTSKNEGIE